MGDSGKRMSPISITPHIKRITYLFLSRLTRDHRSEARGIFFLIRGLDILVLASSDKLVFMTLNGGRTKKKFGSVAVSNELFGKRGTWIENR